MGEVARRTVRTFVDVARDLGVPFSALIVSTSLSQEELFLARAMDWATFVTLHDNLARALPQTGRVRTLEDFGVAIVRSPSFAFLRRVARFLPKVRHLYAVAEAWLGARSYPHFDIVVRDEPDGRLLVSLDLARTFPDTTSFFRVVAGMLTHLPELFDLPPAVGERVVEPHSMRLWLRLPEDHSAWSRATRRVRAFLRTDRLVTELASQQAMVEASVQALDRTRREFRDVLEAIPACVGVHRDGKFLWTNRELGSVLGVPPEELVGMPILSFVHEDERAHVLRRSMLPPERTPHAEEHRMIRADGTVVWVEIGRTQVLDFDGGPARIIHGHDVTERRRLRDQIAVADRMASLGMLAASVAHEVNNPLTYAAVQVDLAMRAIEHDPRSARESLVIAREGLDRVRTIVADLRTIARPDDDEEERVDLHEVLRATIGLATSEIRARAELVQSFDAVPAVFGRRSRLGQVFLNLLVNAVEAIPEDAHDARVRVRTRRAGQHVVVDISDTGVGLSPENAARVFEPFFTTKPVGRGTGLGLSICHSIVTRLGGEIVVVPSEPPYHTTFRVSLRAAGEAAVEPLRPPSSRPQARARVLVVDDEPRLLSALATILSDLHDVVAADSGERALALVAEDERFDVILCDLMMNGLDGIALHDELERARPALAERIVFMTGGAFTPRARAFLARIPNVCIDKPLDMRSLLALIEARLDSARRGVPEAATAG